MDTASDHSTDDAKGEITSASPTGVNRGNVRFTSNIVGPLLLLRDAACCLIAVPLALAVYSSFFGERIVPSVHLFALAAMIGTFILLRVSKDSYLQNLFTISSRGD